ncbi:MAG: sulfotransferase [marine bacterium B5-7]|nr:MAG: sulfotransferase [marine bacterium B5-7]
MPDSVFHETLDRLNGVFDKQIFFVCGVMKSGTTWLERLVDAHPEAICKGEAHFGGQVVRPFVQWVKDYNLEISRKGGAIAHLKKHGGTTDVLAYDDRDVAFLSIATIGMMFGKWLNDDRVKCIGDKTPGNLDDMPMLSSLFPEARFIHIIRDGRDVAVSLWHFNLKTDIGKTVQNWGTFENFAKDFAGGWADKIEEGRKQGLRLGQQRYLEVTYETLLEQPETELKNIFEFLSVDSQVEIVRQCVDACAFKKLSGGRGRGEEDSESFYRKGIAGDWKNHFTPQIAADFEEMSKGLLERLGYSD